MIKNHLRFWLENRHRTTAVCRLHRLTIRPAAVSEHQERVSVCTFTHKAHTHPELRRRLHKLKVSFGFLALSTLLCATIFAAVALRRTLKILKATSSSSCLPVKVGLTRRRWNISSVSILDNFKLILEKEDEKPWVLLT